MQADPILAVVRVVGPSRFPRAFANAIPERILS